MTDPGHRRGRVDEHALGRQVRAFSAAEHSYTHGEGTVVAYTPRPSVLIRRPGGALFSWIADLCEFTDPPTTAPAPPPSTASWTSEGVDFLRRVVAGEVYTGMSGEALAMFAVGLTDKPRWAPADRADLARCMNVYWSAPESLRPVMRRKLEFWSRDIKQPINFDARQYYLRHHNLIDYWGSRKDYR